MNDSVLPDKLTTYIEEHTTPLCSLLQKIERETHLHVLHSNMLSGSYQGQLLQILSKTKQPKRILEIGTYTGYSTLCLASGLQPDGEIHTIDVNKELMERTQTYFNESSYARQIHLHIGEALPIIEELPTPFDLVFIDADKRNYINYYELVIDKMNQHGLIIADNVLWKGRVLEDEKDNKTQQMHVFNQAIQSDRRVRNIMLPVRDGLLVVQKL